MSIAQPKLPPIHTSTILESIISLGSYSYPKIPEPQKYNFPELLIAAEWCPVAIFTTLYRSGILVGVDKHYNLGFPIPKLPAELSPIE